MTTPAENPEEFINNDTTDKIEISEDSSVLPTPPQTPKTNYSIPENDNSNENLTEEEEIKQPITFKHINVSVLDEINDINPNLDDDSSEEDENDEESNEEYEDINIGEEFDENQTNNPENLASSTSLLSISKEDNENNENNDNEDVPMPNLTVPPVPSSEPSPIPTGDSFDNLSVPSNSNGISFGALISQNGENITYSYNSDSTLNSGDSTLIQHSSVSSYLDKEDDVMSESILQNLIFILLVQVNQKIHVLLVHYHQYVKRIVVKMPILF